MGVEHTYFASEDGEITGHMACSFVDAVFLYQGKKVLMSFHPYLGPSFDILEGKDEVRFYPGEEPEYNVIWKQFDGWWDAKGKELYK